ncbi:Cysteine desulfurase [bioreactor metagenome]|uniref:cysteine desulfurase n=1 Tax=bioreactor metagenome TaxID=1076179 RepID=A0A644VHV2_9ZZZZ
MNRIVNIEGMRSHFPALGQQVHGKDLVYFDNGATAQKPQSVISLINEMNSGTNGNIHRAVHELSARCTSLYESARLSIKDFINSPSSEEIIFTSGTTASINLVAFSFTQRFINKGDSVIICEADHHSNIVPWQMACERSGAELKILPVDENGEWNLEQLDSILDEKVKIVSVAHISNVLGIENPVSLIIEKAHKAGARVLLDGAQGIVHGDVDVQKLDCDFYAFSGHKLYGPTGTGVLYGKREILEEISPWMGGGDMVDTVTLSKTTYAPIPLKFEAGTPNFIGAAALGEAVNFIKRVDKNFITGQEKLLTSHLLNALKDIDGLVIYGSSANKLPIFSFNVEGVHHTDLAMLLDKMGIAVRSGMMCCEPLMNRFNVTGMVRASLLSYNTIEETDMFILALQRAIRMLK